MSISVLMTVVQNAAMPLRFSFARTISNWSNVGKKTSLKQEIVLAAAAGSVYYFIVFT